MSPGLTLAVAAVGGLFLGVGVVVGAFMVRAIRHYVRLESGNEPDP
jgi:hypothetical protein